MLSNAGSCYNDTAPVEPLNDPQHSLPILDPTHNPTQDPAPVPTPQPADEPNVPYWQPTHGETMKLLGWRWLLALPALAMVGLTIVGLVVGNPFLAYNTCGFGVITFVIIIPAVVLGHAARTAVSMRKEPFCIHCGYDLTSQPDHYRCPECGRPYTFAQINEYRQNPWWYNQRRKLATKTPAAQIPLATPAARNPSPPPREHSA